MKLEELIASIGQVQPEAVGLDGFPILTADPHGWAQSMLDAYLRAAREAQFEQLGAEISQGKKILDETSERRAQLIYAAFVRVGWIVSQTYYAREERVHALVILLDKLVSRPVVYTGELMLWLGELLGGMEHVCAQNIAWDGLLRGFEEHLARGGLGKDEISGLLRLKGSALLAHDTPEHATARVRVEKMLAGCHEQHVELGHPWADALHDDLEAMDPITREAWDLLLAHIPSSSPKASARWTRKSKELVGQIGAEVVRASLLRWLPLVGRRASMSFTGLPASSPLSSIPSERNEELLRGLIWLGFVVGDETMSGVLADVAMACYHKLPGHGPRCPKLGNACIWSLGQMEQIEGVGQLWRLKQRITYVSAHRIIDNVTAQVSERLHISEVDLEELSVPTFGLGLDGGFEQMLGDWSFELSFDATRQSKSRWVRETVNGQAQLFAMTRDTQVQLTTPRDVLKKHAEEWEALEARIHELEKMLATQRDRLEGVYLRGRSWDFETWRERYLEHPLMRLLVKDLVWVFEDAICQDLLIYRGDGFEDVSGREFSAADLLGSQVQLWHPSMSSEDETRAWQEWLVEHRVTQPFKQAHRELYWLDGSEEATIVCDPHVLRQHQFAALCKTRGWSCKLQGGWQLPPMPELELHQRGLRAQLWVQAVVDRSLMTRAGGYIYVVMDRLAFLDEEGSMVDPHGIEPIVISEVLRDLDMFVSVAGVQRAQVDEVLSQALAMRGMDDVPARAPGAALRGRRDVLAQLVSLYEWGGRCAFEGEHLVVETPARVLRLELMTGLVSDEQARLVDLSSVRRALADADAPSRAYLPFSGDPMLVTLLQRAYLLTRCDEGGVRARANMGR